LGVRLADGSFSYAPEATCMLEQDDILITIGDRKHTTTLQKLAEGKGVGSTLWQTIPYRESAIVSERLYSLPEAEQVIQNMSKHFIICGSGKVAQRSINALNPERSFVVITDDDNWTKELISRGFRVIYGSSTDEKILAKAGIKRAQAIMVTLEDEAQSVLTILNSRSVNKQLLITATAYSDDMVTKLERAGADRVVSPFHVAASFMLLATTAPDISDFIRYVLFNYQAGIETTELYMETDSPWIGRTIGSLNLQAQFKAGVIGIRMAQKTNFIYAPDEHYVIEPNEVLVIITPMKYADKLRDLAHGNESKRPTTLRTRVTQSAKWTQEEIMKMIQDR
jgi:voltage-gated potassium channel